MSAQLNACRPGRNGAPQAHQITLNTLAVSCGGHARTGLEDNVRLDRNTLAPSNAALVRRVVDLCDAYGRPVATGTVARQMLGLPKVPA